MKQEEYNKNKRSKALAKKRQKPMAPEEFGFPRDDESYSPDAPAVCRDKFYALMFEQMKGRIVAGCNFWGFVGTGRPAGEQKYWKKGDDFLADPPMEEQGLNSVFDSDASTRNVIEQFVNK